MYLRSLFWIFSIGILTACQSQERKAFEQFIQSTGPQVDLWIREGSVYNGIDSIPFSADILVRADTIAYIGYVDSSRINASQVIRAEGKVVSPGFIDTHAHGDPIQTPDFANFLAQGVTTVCLGQDGSSPAFADLTSWMDQVDRASPGVNMVMFAGHGTLRQISGAGYEPVPTPGQMEKMKALLQDAFDAGCFGLSTGLEYTPGFYAQEKELEELARVVGQNNGLLTSHMRNEDDDAIEASLRELLRQGKYCNVQASHLKVVYGKGEQRAEEILALLDSARQAGSFSVTADVYPYTASYTGIGIVFPAWAKPPNDYAKVKRQRKDELLEFLRQKVLSRNGPEATLFGTAPYAGKTLAQLAQEQGKPYEEILLEIGPGGASAAYFVMDEALQARLISDPHVMICSDGSPTMHHPRGYGSFARIIEEYVNTAGRFPLHEAIRKMTSFPAQTLGLSDRGVLQTGKKADIAIFDPKAVKARAAFSDPHQPAVGFDHVLVNGKIAWSMGKASEKGSGRMIKKPENPN